MTNLRTELRAADRYHVRRLVEATSFFSVEERDIAVELVDVALEKGDASGYLFVFADGPEGPLGYACYGPIPGTRASYDLYWIVVDPAAQGTGTGRRVLADVERRIVQAGGTRLYADTSSRAQYAPTQAFYVGVGYTIAAHLEDYYSPGDGKLTYLKILA